jgi:hypothetical protein
LIEPVVRFVQEQRITLLEVVRSDAPMAKRYSIGCVFGGNVISMQCGSLSRGANIQPAA